MGRVKSKGIAPITLAWIEIAEKALSMAALTGRRSMYAEDRRRLDRHSERLHGLRLQVEDAVRERTGVVSVGDLVLISDLSELVIKSVREFGPGEKDPE